MFFLFTHSKRCGARFLRASPSSQLWCQNYAFIPSPIVTVVEALKRSVCPASCKVGPSRPMVWSLPHSLAKATANIVLSQIFLGRARQVLQVPSVWIPSANLLSNVLHWCFRPLSTGLTYEFCQSASWPKQQGGR